VALVFAGLAIGGLLGWRWVFWADLVVLLLTLANSLLRVAGPVSSPLATSVTDTVLDVATAALIAWMIIAAIRYGPWAMRRPRAA
jgi:hypothetical protein